MIIVRLIGGMGNQLFQYAYALQLMSQYKQECYLDLTWFNNKNRKSHERFMLDKFTIDPNVKLIRYYKDLNKLVTLTDRLLVHIDEFIYSALFHMIGMKKADKYMLYLNRKLRKSGVYWYTFQYDYLDIRLENNTVNYVIGYWQTMKYFEKVSGSIKQSLCVIDDKLNNIKIKEDIINTASVAIHIRRGDYVGNEAMNVCNLDYYIKAIDYIDKKVKAPKFYIFSNDIKWVKTNVRFNDNLDINYIDFTKSDFEDFAIMRLCKHFIMSNSTFSWWAQFLSDNDEKLVIAPSIWDNKCRINDIYQENWVKI